MPASPVWSIESRKTPRSVLRLFTSVTGYYAQPPPEYRLPRVPVWKSPVYPELAQGLVGFSALAPDSRLMCLPTEMLVKIAEHLADDRAALSALSLVNHFFLSLARCYLFDTVRLDYGPRTWGLLWRLCYESHQRALNGGQTIGPSIGACIRRIRVKTDVSWVQCFHDLWLYDKNRHYLAGGAEHKNLRVANSCYFDNYIPLIGRILDRKTLLRLDAFTWEDPVLLEKPFFDGLVRSSIRHLTLSSGCVREDFSLETPSGGPWPLQSLTANLEVRRHRAPQTPDVCPSNEEDEDVNADNDEDDDDDDNDNDTGLFFTSASLLRLCAPTIETLSWRLHRARQPLSVHPGPISFPRLRVVDLASNMELDDSLVASLVTSRLARLGVDMKHDASTLARLFDQGHMPSFKSFCWAFEAQEPEETRLLDFLADNPQLEKLCLGVPTSAEFLDWSVVPLLASSFSHLTSLSLCWRGTSIAASSLAAVGALRSLEDLQIGALNRFDFDPWGVDHDVVRRALRRLARLRRLAFANDSYRVTADNPHKSYYAEQDLEPGDYATACARPDLDGASIVARVPALPAPCVWELSHRNRMLAEAERYAAVLPSLEWLLLGQIPMAVRRARGHDGAEVVAQWCRRDECLEAVKEIWGCP